MKFLCTSNVSDDSTIANSHSDTIIGLFTRDSRFDSTVGAAIVDDVRRFGLVPHLRAWDFLTIAISAVAVDLYTPRRSSPDGWTRSFDLTVAVSDPDLWTACKRLVEEALQRLTTDRWTIQFTKSEMKFRAPRQPRQPSESCVSLLSGGLDSLNGAIDLIQSNNKPFFVSHIVRGDRDNQRHFSSTVAKELSHIQLNHNGRSVEKTQRARSLAFISYGVLIASTLNEYNGSRPIDLFMPENGLISINPPLTPMRLGSLSTRTTNPIFIKLIQEILDKVDLHVRIRNPYQFKTKGEMLTECKDQTMIKKLAHLSTSCGRYNRYGYQHCGRCIPCLIRRSAFLKWGFHDETEYKYDNLSLNDTDHAGWDDVRSALMGYYTAKHNGIHSLTNGVLSSTDLGNVSPYEDVAMRGIQELADFLINIGVK